MGRTIKARVSKGLLEPLEPLEMREGEEVTVTILNIPTALRKDALERSAGGWRGLIDAEELKRNIYANRLITTRPEPKL